MLVYFIKDIFKYIFLDPNEDNADINVSFINWTRNSCFYLKLKNFLKKTSHNELVELKRRSTRRFNGLSISSF